MFTAKPTSRSVFFSLLLLLLLAIFTATSLSSELTAPDEDSGDLGDLQELIALDEEADLSSEGGRHESKDKPSGAELLSRAHRIVLELNSDNTKSAIDEEAKNQEIVIWRKKKTGAPVLRINSINEATGIFQITLKSLSAINISIGEGSDFTGVPTKFMSVNGSLRISVYNPATFYGIHVSSTPINLVFSNITVATGQLKKYYQPKKSRRTVMVNIQGTKVPLYGAGSSLTTTKNKDGTVGYQIPLALDFEVKSQGDMVGKLGRTEHRRKIWCEFIIDSFSNKPIKFKKHSCAYT